MLWLQLLVVISVTSTVAGQIGQITNIAEFPFDESSRLASHLLAYYGNDECKLQVENINMDLREPVSVDENVAKLLFGDVSSNCAVACLERGTYIDQISTPLPYQIHRSARGMSEFVHNKCQKAEIGFLSYAKGESNIFWINPDGTSVKIGTLKIGEKNTSWQQTYLGHIFEIRDIETNELLKRVTVEHNAIVPIGNPKSSVTVRDVRTQVKNTFYSEWERAHRVKRTFTDLGFNRGQLPRDLWGSISAYYYNNRMNKVREEWDSKGVFVNWWETDVFFIPMPWELKKYWQSRLKTLVEAWSGVELELTDIYGMRRYEDGARLLTHVDREATHAASLIINVAQGEIRKPWTVEIYDFADRLHEVEMAEGDIVYYESARCLHGRMQPLEGAFYVNLFAHYRPVGDPQWFLKQNPADAPKQLMDIGECTTNGTAVQCSKITPQFLSPYLDTLHGAEDLYNFWEKVAPKPKEESVHGEL